jgi:shikimate kinase
MNIVLIGYRCCGKSSVGRYIAERTGREYVDTDELIEKKAGSTIEEIISDSGWNYFREIEKGVVKEISAGDNLVIATGGGIVMNKENIFNLKRNGFVVWLKGDVEVIRARMNRDEENGDIRPSLTGENAVDEIKDVLDIRGPLYKKAGDMTVDTSHISIPEVAELIINGSGLDN